MMSEPICDFTAELLSLSLIHEQVERSEITLHLHLQVQHLMMSKMFEPDYDPLKRIKVRVRIEEVESD